MAYDEHSIYLNGRQMPLPDRVDTFVSELCATRRIQGPLPAIGAIAEVVAWIAKSGGFALPET
jgi:hypothetical protein